MLCNDCPQRDLCTSLCPEAEAYTNQDAPNYHKANDSLHFTPLETKIIRLLGRGKTKAQIRKYLKLSIDALNSHIYRLCKKSDDIEIRAEDEKIEGRL